jgi:hypothetical protein
MVPPPVTPAIFGPLTMFAVATLMVLLLAFIVMVVALAR